MPQFFFLPLFSFWDLHLNLFKNLGVRYNIIHYYNLLWYIGLFLFCCCKYLMLFYDVRYIILGYLNYLTYTVNYYKLL
jgi:hypothetical protein